MAKRNQLTLPRAEFYEPLRHLEPAVRYSVFDAILDFFFEDKILCYGDYDTPTRTALACMMPGLRKVQSQFDNGKTEKKLRKNTQGLLCPLETSQTKPIQAKGDSSIIYNNKIDNNIYNKQTKNNQQPSADELRIEKAHEELLKKIDQLKSSPSATDKRATIIRAEELISRLALECEPQTINRQPMAVADVLERYQKAFEHEPEKTIHNLERIFNMFDEACFETKITNTYKYLVALFYNQALVRPPRNVDEFKQRTYTNQELNNLFDNLDDIKI